jgi:hypothetical protein
MELEIIIEGVSDSGLERILKRRIQTVCANGPRAGWRSVFVAPSETRGEWDLTMRTDIGRNFASFVGGDDRLPDLVGAQLRAWV